MGLVSRFPDDWRTDVTVLRGGGRDDWGNPQPVQELPLTDCAIGPRATSEPLDRTDLTSSDMILYRDPDSEFSFQSTDRIRVPSGHRNSGVWSVNGRPQEWPMGVEVPLKEAG